MKYEKIVTSLDRGAYLEPSRKRKRARGTLAIRTETTGRKKKEKEVYPLE